MDPAAPSPFTPADALKEIAGVTGKQASLRSRIEGMTWVLWGLVVALQAMTLGALADAAPAATFAERHFEALASHAWVLVAVVASVGIWRAAAVNFDPCISRKRALAFFIGWPVLFAIASYAVAGFGGGAFRFAVVSAVLLAAFALVNPVRYTPRGRVTAGALAVAAAGVAAVVWLYGEPGYAWFALTGTAIGLSWVFGGLYALYRG